MGINECRHEASHAEEENRQNALSLNILKIKTQAYTRSCSVCLLSIKQCHMVLNETNPNSHNKIDMVLCM